MQLEHEPGCPVGIVDIDLVWGLRTGAASLGMLAKVHRLAVLYEEVLGTLGNHVALPCGGGPGEPLGCPQPALFSGWGVPPGGGPETLGRKRPTVYRDFSTLQPDPKKSDGVEALVRFFDNHYHCPCITGSGDPLYTKPMVWCKVFVLNGVLYPHLEESLYNRITEITSFAFLNWREKVSL